MLHVSVLGVDIELLEHESSWSTVFHMKKTRDSVRCSQMGVLTGGCSTSDMLFKKVRTVLIVCLHTSKKKKKIE